MFFSVKVKYYPLTDSSNLMLIALHITPNSSKNQIIGWKDATNGKKELKIKIAAQPEDGKANSEIIHFLSKQWQIPKSALEIVSGLTSKHKQLKIPDSYTAIIKNVIESYPDI